MFCFVDGPPCSDFPARPRVTGYLSWLVAHGTRWWPYTSPADR